MWGSQLLVLKFKNHSSQAGQIFLITIILNNLATPISNPFLPRLTFGDVLDLVSEETKSKGL